MSLQQNCLQFEIKIWDMIIPFIEENGPLRTIIDRVKRVMRTRIIKFAVLIFIWAKVGFIFGLVLGRIIWMFQLL
jgi:nitrate reductase NapE component